jgi:hypothetical protein
MGCECQERTWKYMTKVTDAPAARVGIIAAEQHSANIDECSGDIPTTSRFGSNPE